MSQRALLFVLLVFWIASVFGAEEPKNSVVYVIGAGQYSCGGWLAAKSDISARLQYKQWVMGFVSGSNYRTRIEQSRPTDSEAVSAFLDQYCTKNPFHTLLLAAAAVVGETGGPRADHQWKR